KNLPLPESINLILDEIAEQYNISLKQEHYGLRFRELIRSMAQEKQLAILIDEYDKPIIDYLEKEKIPQAIEHREILKNFYSALKSNDENIRFLLMTGVSKFSKVIIFSELNHLYDISIDTNYAALCGYTQDELQLYFKTHINNIRKKFRETDTNQAIREWYNGYSWDDLQFVYNPFSILNFLSRQSFGDFWFSTGTPTFLIKLIKERNYNLTQFHRGFETEIALFDHYEIENLELIPLLFQTGYLTIKSLDPLTGETILDYPNYEVRKSFDNYLLSSLSETPLAENRIVLKRFVRSLQEKDIESFIQQLKALFKSITYPLIRNEEAYYHSIFFTLLRLLGFEIETEILTADGRIDTVIKTSSHIFIIEFKLGTPQEALNQIKNKEYALKYASDIREKVLLGIGFSTELKNIEGFLEE
ncbi:MAG: AAA family ATPase, partial [Bacteroidota bacterium]